MLGYHVPVQLSAYGQYLASKKSVDDRALNAGVLSWLRSQLTQNTARAVRVLEVGAGLGTMAARLKELEVLQRAEYVLLDADAQLLRDAHSWLSAWAQRSGLGIRTTAEGMLLCGPGGTSLSLRFVHSDMDEFLSGPDSQAAFDVLIANAVLDLVDVPATLPRLLNVLVAGGLYWFSINFDGETIFLPEDAHDEAFMRVYHRSMDERLHGGNRVGDSRTGRHLFGHLQAAGARVSSAGSSDWIVFANQGRYPHAEADFLRHIVRTVDEELQRHTEVDPEARMAWTSLRSAQIDRGELIYIAHQLDVAGAITAG
jgi:SAM-dependent methyltransferase